PRCLVVLAALAALTVVIIKIGLNASSRFEFLFCSGVAMWIGAQTLFNIGAVVGVLPVTGVPLPLISAGGTSLVVLMAALGLVNGTARRPAERFGQAPARTRSIR
ncbi:MAG: FtsW/RodA/SpoVE family cell cycle protein, partial [Actinomycetota bacterium]|nr:FtsW/RodA/SpoVE family cell cycle protein [Actinomycetota bacterium]